MQEKLRDLMKSEGLKPGQLAEVLGVNPAGISHIMAGRNNPSFEMLQKILRQFPRLNPDWLLVDRGPMYRDEPNRETVAAAPNPTRLFERISTTSAEAADRVQPEPTAAASVIADAAPARCRPTRVVIFYEDGSFESFHPTGE